MTTIDRLLEATNELRAGGRVISLDDLNIEGETNGQVWVDQLPVSVRELWPSLSTESRLVAYLFAQQECYLGDADC